MITHVPYWAPFLVQSMYPIRVNHITTWNKLKHQIGIIFLQVYPFLFSVNVNPTLFQVSSLLEVWCWSILYLFLSSPCSYGFVCLFVFYPFEQIEYIHNSSFNILTCNSIICSTSNLLLLTVFCLDMSCFPFFFFLACLVIFDWMSVLNFVFRNWILLFFFQYCWAMFWTS